LFGKRRTNQEEHEDEDETSSGDSSRFIEATLETTETPSAMRAKDLETLPV